MGTKFSNHTYEAQRPLNDYLAQDIEQSVYRMEKAKLMSTKKSLEEQITTMEQKQTGWIEPMREWIKEAQLGAKIATEHRRKFIQF